MSGWGFGFNRRSTAADQVRRELIDPLDLMGIGTPGHGRWGHEDQQPYERDSKLMGARLPYTARQMFTEDPKVQMAVRAMLTMAHSAEWEWERGRGTPLADELALEANQLFGWGATGSGRMRRDWDEVVEEIMLVGPAAGFAYNEVIYELQRWDGELRWGIGEYAYRPPESHRGWDIDGDRLLGARQTASATGADAYIPAHKLLLFGYGAGPDNYWGTGWCRAAYPWYELKRNFRANLKVAGQRDAMSSIKVTIDQKACQDAGYKQNEIRKMIRRAHKFAAEYSAGGRSWFATPKGIDVERFPSDLKHAGHVAVITQCNQEILAACLGAPLLEMGVVGPGNHSIGELFGDKMADNVAGCLDVIGRRLGGRLGQGRGTATRVHDLNRGRRLDPADYPNAVHRGLRKDPLLQILGQLPALRASGFVTPTDRLNRDILRSVGRTMDESARRSVDERMAGANNDVVTTGPAGGPQGKPTSPSSIEAAIGRVEGS